MRTLIIAVGLSLFACGGAPAEDKYSHLFQKDFDQLQGDWDVTGFVVGGEDRLAKKGEKKKYVVNFFNNLVNLPDDQRTYSLNLNPTEKPKHLDLLGQLTPGKQQMMMVHGIYELNGDTLRICVPVGDPTKLTNRPTEFASPKGSNWALITLKRAKS